VRAPRPRDVGVAAIAWLLFLVLLATGSAVLPWGLGLDHAIHTWALAYRAPAAVSVSVAVTTLGTSWVTISATGLVAVAMTRGTLGRRLVRGGVVLAVMVSGVLCRSLLSVLIGRIRPPRQDWATLASGLSFPSGHSTDAALAAGLIAWLVVERSSGRARTRVLVWVVAIGYAAAVGATRVYLGVHWPTDVLGGWTFATAWLTTVWAFKPSVCDLRRSGYAGGRTPRCGRSPARRSSPVAGRRRFRGTQARKGLM
jgi:undecaprenyl-diphosphatase